MNQMKILESNYKLVANSLVHSRTVEFSRGKQTKLYLEPILKYFNTNEF